MSSSKSNPKWLCKLGAGEVLFEQGERSRRVYVLIAGQVEVIRDGARVAEIGVADTFIGEVAALTGRSRWATVRTLAPSNFLVFEDIGQLFELEPSWGIRLATVLAERLDRMNGRFLRLQELLAITRRSNDENAERSLDSELEGATIAIHV